MNRFYIRPEAVEGQRVAFDEAETHHLVHVLRLGPGALVHALDGRGHELTIRVADLAGRRASGVVVERAARTAESPLELTLAQGLPKGDKLDGIVRMATELGVTRVVPLICRRTVARLEPGRGAARLARWERIAREAAKQSGRATIPEVCAPTPLVTWLRAPREPGLLLCLWEAEATVLDTALPAERPARVTLVVGPEGGLAPEEIDDLRAAGAVVAGLGPRILRTETAGPVGLALLQSRYGDLGRAP